MKTRYYPLGVGCIRIGDHPCNSTFFADYGDNLSIVKSENTSNIPSVLLSEEVEVKESDIADVVLEFLHQLYTKAKLVGDIDHSCYEHLVFEDVANKFGRKFFTA